MLNTQLQYGGKLSSYQQEPSNHKGKTYQTIVYTERQNFLYNRLVYGLEYLPADEIKVMAKSKRKRINIFHRKTLALINQMKQERIVALSDHVFNTFFPKSPMAKDLVLNYREDLEEDFSKIGLETFRITKTDIIDTLIKARLLPDNFYKQILT
jgi:hypothetical protein